MARFDVTTSSMVGSQDPDSWLKKPLAIVIIGASGDLAKKKTYPSLFELYQHGLLPQETIIWGYARSAKTHHELRATLTPYLKKSVIPNAGKSLEDFLNLCYYHHGKSYEDEPSLRRLLSTVGKPYATMEANKLYYLAVPPNVFEKIVHTLSRIPDAVSNDSTKFVIEKPFGRDLDSCRELLGHFKVLPEHMMYRIDHYLGKPMVDNILTLRMSNAWFENLLNRSCVQSIHVRFKESFGVEGRGGYFDQNGIIRDVVQNHLLQILLLLTIQIPDTEKSSDGEMIRQAKVQLLQAMPSIRPEDTLLGQYEGYKEDKTIENKETTCPTYVLLKCCINAPRWEGVPIFLEAGKALDESLVDVTICLRQPRRSGNWNKIVMRIQPSPSLSISAFMKEFGSPAEVSTTVETLLETSYSPSTTSCARHIENAYSRLLLDVLHGKQANFCHADELIFSWKIFSPLLHCIQRNNEAPLSYIYGSKGPTESVRFLQNAVQPTQQKLRSSL